MYGVWPRERLRKDIRYTHPVINFLTTAKTFL